VIHGRASPQARGDRLELRQGVGGDDPELSRRDLAEVGAVLLDRRAEARRVARHVELLSMSLREREQEPRAR
jgi:hypothetical protein